MNLLQIVKFKPQKHPKSIKYTNFKKKKTKEMPPRHDKLMKLFFLLLFSFCAREKNQAWVNKYWIHSFSYTYIRKYSLKPFNQKHFISFFSFVCIIQIFMSDWLKSKNFKTEACIHHFHFKTFCPLHSLYHIQIIFRKSDTFCIENKLVICKIINAISCFSMCMHFLFFLFLLNAGSFIQFIVKESSILWETFYCL